MNTLSWLIYAADVLANASVALTVFAILGAIGVVVTVSVGAIMRADSPAVSDTHARGCALQKKALRWAWAFPVCLLLASVIPSKTTLYMIIASEMGESVISDPDIKEVFDAFKSKVTNYLIEDASE